MNMKEKSLWFKMRLTTMWSVFAIFYITAVTFVEIPLTNDRVVDQVLGFLMGTVVATGLNYWIGTSAEQENPIRKVSDVESDSITITETISSDK